VTHIPLLIFFVGNPFSVVAAVPVAAVVTPVVVAGDSIMGGVRGAASGFNTMVEPFNSFLTNNDNPVVLRAAVAPVAAVSGAIGAVGGAAVGTAKGAVNSVGRVLGNIFGL
jgi:hypothetical protein